jgi:peptide chain release factor 2
MFMISRSKIANNYRRLSLIFSIGFRNLSHRKDFAFDIQKMKHLLVPMTIYYNTKLSVEKSLQNQSILDNLIAFDSNLDDLNELYASSQDDESKAECISMLVDLEHNFRSFRLRSIINSEAINESNCFVEIKAGAGGEDSYDWTGMLVKLFQNWCKNTMGYRVSVINFNSNAVSSRGYRDITLRIDGTNAFGYLRGVAGTHRLVRISPFDPQKKRHTSFAQVIVYPDLDLSAKFSTAIKDSDLRIDTFKSSGAGGQHVNTTDSAVRLTHLPTGIVVTCQNERSQHMNKATAVRMLLSRLELRQIIELNKLREDSMIGLSESSWGNQIISVVLAPYQLVKDHRTNWSYGHVDSYLEGDEMVTDLIETALLWSDEKKYVN